MRIQTTKTLTNALNKEVKKTNYNMRFDHIEISSYDYSRIVSINFDDMEKDYDYRSGKCKAIKVIYPGECYAMENYITTNDLLRIANKIDGTIYDPLTVENFAQHVFEEYEI